PHACAPGGSHPHGLGSLGAWNHRARKMLCVGDHQGVRMLTEHISPRYVDLDSWSSAEMIEAMYEGQLAAAAAVRGALKQIAAAVDDAVPALRRGGRVAYAGAGTSGRIGVQDGSEL